MVIDDEPVYGERHGADPSAAGSDEPLVQRIRRLVSGEPFGVLCTQGEGQPYGSVVGFSFSEDLCSAVFATPIATRKFRLLSENNHVALVVDNRPRHRDNMMEVESITATGRTTRLEMGRGVRPVGGTSRRSTSPVPLVRVRLFHRALPDRYHSFLTRHAISGSQPMDPASKLVVALPEAAALGEPRVGGKANVLSRLIEAGYRVPGGFCVTADAYDLFVSSRGLANVIRMELGRKPLASMRWEELWDAALRIRSAFSLGSHAGTRFEGGPRRL